MSNTTKDKDLMEALAAAHREIEALKTLNRYSDTPAVMLVHSGRGPQLIIPLPEGKSAVLGPRGANKKTSVPLSTAMDLQKQTDYFRKGYIYVEGEEGEHNPNLVLDAEEWLASRSEKQIEPAVNEMDSRAALNYLYDYTETAPRNSKTLTLRDAVARRMEELFGIIVIEDHPGDESVVDTIRVRKN